MNEGRAQTEVERKEGSERKKMGINSTKKGGNLEIKERGPKKEGIQKNGKEAKKCEERNKLQTETIR